MKSAVIKNLSTLAEKRTEHLQILPPSFASDFYNRHAADASIKLYQIKNNQLFLTYNDPFPEYETRIAGSNSHLLGILKNYQMPDMEFIYCDQDSLNTNMPIFVPGCSAERQQLLCPDFMFKINPECHLNDHDSDIKKVFDHAEMLGDRDSWMQRENKIVYRGSLNNTYRGSYGRLDGWKDICDFKHIVCHSAPRGMPNYTIGLTPHAMTREEKTKYKYQLHLNGHEDSAISGAFRYALACKSLVFYGTSSPYQEWWQHNLIFRENEHYVRANSPHHLTEILEYFVHHQDHAFKIACESFEFAKEYFTGEATELYYASLLQEYAKRNPHPFELHSEARRVTSYKKRISENEVIEVIP